MLISSSHPDKTYISWSRKITIQDVCLSYKNCFVYKKNINCFVYLLKKFKPFDLMQNETKVKNFKMQTSILTK